MSEAEIIEWIEENNLAAAPYKGIVKDGEIDGYEVYSINYLPDANGNYPIIGLPSFILIKDKEIKTSYGNKAFKIMDRLSPKDKR